MIRVTALPHVRLTSKIFGREQSAAFLSCKVLQSPPLPRKKILSGKNGSVTDVISLERLPDRLQDILFWTRSFNCLYFYEPYLSWAASITLQLVVQLDIRVLVVMRTLIFEREL
jgi:hypothetical protein